MLVHHHCVNGITRNAAYKVLLPLFVSYPVVTYKVLLLLKVCISLRTLPQLPTAYASPQIFQLSAA